MKSEKNNPETVANVETAAVETAAVETAAEKPEKELTPTEKKASAILRAKLPHLSEKSLNFEKRSGNFFRATLAMQQDGTEKVSRLVVEDAKIEGMTDALAAEMEIKRAAARVMSAESDAAKLEKKIEEARKELADLEAEKAAAAETLEKDIAAVEAYELPEKTAKETLTRKVANLTDENARLAAEYERVLAMLKAAGIDPAKK